MPSIPIIAIVGRPNVGKSTLFNRYAGTRRALVRDEPGVTRDRIVEEIEIGDRPFLVVDTAGFDLDANSGLSGAVQAQALIAVEEADGVLFVVDGQVGLLPEDEEIARVLRRGNKPILTVVNKIDAVSHTDRMSDFYRLGFAQPPRPVSAEHGRGVFEVLEELAAAIPEDQGPAKQGHEGAGATEQGARPIKVAIVGRPNVGKSSLVNRILGDERMVVSDVPGTTRDAVDVRIEDPQGPIILIDTAGIRRPGRRRAAQEQIVAILALRAIERADVVLQMLDASENVTEQDTKIASMVLQRGRPLILLLNKWDTLGRGRDRKEAGVQIHSELDRRLHFVGDAPVLGISAKTGTRVDRIFPLVHKLRKVSGKRIKTAELNRWLRETTERHSPAMAMRARSARRPIKFFYGTQVGIQPPSFVFFCTDPSVIQGSYKRFLENSLRDVFQLQGTPIRVALRKRTQKHVGGAAAE